MEETSQKTLLINKIQQYLDEDGAPKGMLNDLLRIAKYLPSKYQYIEALDVIKTNATEAMNDFAQWRNKNMTASIMKINYIPTGNSCYHIFIHYTYGVEEV